MQYFCTNVWESGTVDQIFSNRTRFSVRTGHVVAVVAHGSVYRFCGTWKFNCSIKTRQMNEHIVSFLPNMEFEVRKPRMNKSDESFEYTM